MLVSLIHAHVKPDQVEAFKAATIENARNSRQEPGIARFDVTQHRDDPTRFVMIEVFRDAEAPVAHKATRHYQVWRDTVEPMMAEPRTGVGLATVDPPDDDW